MERTAEERAAEIGREHGHNAGMWVFDGNTTQETYRAALAGLEDVDPMILNAFDLNIPNLDAAGDYTLADLAEELGISEDGPGMDAAHDAYLVAAGEAYWAEVERAARCQLRGES